jgi:hypothetical protein
MCPFGAISPDLYINYTVHFMHINTNIYVIRGGGATANELEGR